MLRRLVAGFAGVVVVPAVMSLSGCAPTQGLALEETAAPPAALHEGLPSIAETINAERSATPSKPSQAPYSPSMSPVLASPSSLPQPAEMDPDSRLASLPPTEDDDVPQFVEPADGRPQPYKSNVPATARVQAARLMPPPAERPRALPVAAETVPRPQMAALPGRDTPPARSETISPLAKPILNEPPTDALSEAPPVIAAASPVQVPEAKPQPSPPTTPKAANVEKLDPSVQSTNRTEPSKTMGPPTSKGAGWVASVGEEIITWSEFQPAVASRLRQMGSDGQIDSATKNKVAASVLDSMIEQSMLVQEMKRKLKNPKMQTMFNDQMMKVWQDEELPVMLREAKAANEFELRAILEKGGQSIDRLKRNYLRNMMAREVMHMELSRKMKVDLPEMRAYYNENLKDFDRLAQITWREIQIDFGKFKTKAGAKKRADEILERLRRGDDFAKLAKEFSHGPTASKGGLWETAPGSYNVPSVNAVLNTQPIGQISTIIESPTSYHVVIVEARREAGPARFDEVQDKIRNILFERKVEAATTAYMKKLRSRTVISTMFDNTESDPSRYR